MSKGKEVDEILENTVNYQKTFRTVHGGQVLDDLFNRAGVFQVAPDLDGHTLAYWEGRRALALEIKAMVDADLSELQKDTEYVQ